MSEKRLRGLGSLISSTSGATSAPSSPTMNSSDTQLMEIPVDGIVPNPRQPRRVFDKDALNELADSIRQHGLLQPVVVRPVGDTYELVAGERRWRATKLAGKETITAVCKPVDNIESLTLSIIENLQREDLDPIEEAIAYRTLVTELSLTQEEVASHVGKERSTISNALRLLDLPLSIQAKLQSGSLSPGHARVLLAVSDPTAQLNLAERAADKGMSVREIERLVYGSEGVAPGGAEAGPEDERKLRPAHIAELERQIAARVGTKVRLKEGRRGGKLVISFANDKEFLRILEVLGVDTTAV
jgi:ParB family chromosome partitioning protein